MAHSPTKQPAPVTTPAQHDHDHGFAHPMSIEKLLGVFFALVFLTILTVTVSDFADMLHLGRFEIWVSLGIATIKAALVIFFFMHLLYDKPFNKMLFFAAFLFVALFIGITLMDSNQYQGDIRAYQSEQIDDGK